MYIAPIPLREITGDNGSKQSTVYRSKVDLLASHLAQGGQREPVIVRKEDGAYSLVRGHLCCAAARVLGWPAVQALVVEGGREDLQRAGEHLAALSLTLAERADLVHALRQAYTARELSVWLGYSESYLRNLSRLRVELSAASWTALVEAGPAATYKGWLPLLGMSAGQQRRWLEASAERAGQKRGRPRVDLERQLRELDAQDVRAAVLRWVLGKGTWPAISY